MAEAVHAAASGPELARNIAVHDRIAYRYDSHHDEIFNDHEQARLNAALAEAKAAVRGRDEPYRALDFGCGSGNLTRHLLGLGMTVTSSDVSRSFLDLVNGRFPDAALDTHQLNGEDLREFPDGSFDFIATYSVLHHVPNYLAAVAEMARVCAPGGVIYIDHELNADFWRGSEEYRRFQAEALPFDWRKFLRPSNYYHKIRRLFNPRYTNEGDIHVWPDDHVEWDQIMSVLAGLGFSPVIECDYLLFRGRYRRDVYEFYASRLTDTRVMAFRRTLT